MVLPYHLYDEETRHTILSAFQIAEESGLLDDLALAEAAEEIGIEFDDRTGLTRRGQLAVAARIPVERERPRNIGRLRQRLLRKAANREC